MKNLIFSQKIHDLIHACNQRYSKSILKPAITNWIKACIKGTVSGNRLLVYDRGYHGLCPRWEKDLAGRLGLPQDIINKKDFYPDREILNQICLELDMWVKNNPDEAKFHHLAISTVGLCIVCPGEFKFK